MKQPEVFKKIGGIIQELNEQYEYLQTTADDLNDLELELFVANTHFLKDHAEILRKLNVLKSQQQPALPPHADPQPAETDVPVAEPKSLPHEPKYFEPVVQQKTVEQTPFKPVEFKPDHTQYVHFELAQRHDEAPEPGIDLHSGTGTDSYSFEREEPETIRHELVLDEAENWDDEEEAPAINGEAMLTPRPEPIIKKAEPERQVTEAEEPIPTNPEPVVDNTPKTKAEQGLAEDEQVLSFNQKMAARLKEQQTTATQPQPVEPPIQDIKAAINLNDKLLFIKDLFNGYSLAYSEAVDIVNRFKSFEEAERFLKTNYVIKNNWEGKKATADKFYAILKRRYA